MTLPELTPTETHHSQVDLERRLISTLWADQWSRPFAVQQQLEGTDARSASL